MLTSRDRDLVLECLESGWISSSGRYLDEFERGWADVCGRKYGAAVSNGTAALQLAVAALQLEEGDEIVMPSFTIISCALAAVHNGCKPVVVDADPDTWCMDVSAVEAAITPRTRAVMPVHIYGHPVDMEPLLDLAARKNLAVIEDAAEAHGAEYKGTDGSWRRCGSFGDLSTFSFYANKLVTTGEGGMVVTDDPTLDARLRSLRNLAFGKKDRFVHEEIGYNWRLTNLQAALGVAQLDRFADTVARKRAIGARYSELLSTTPVLQLPAEQPWARNVYWMYGVVLRENANVDSRSLARTLAADGIETRPFFTGLHQQPALQRMGFMDKEMSLPVTERISQRGLYLPSGIGLTDGDLERVADSIRRALR